jgi:2-(1,2-epoxy-1,2-dihydrophenyl)acetyl-CoA isomerase
MSDADKDEGKITIEIDGAIARVVIDRPHRKNALTVEMRQALTEGFDRLNRNDDIRAVIVTGGGDAFCSGADVGRMRVQDVKAARARIRAGAHALIRSLAKLEKPVIAVVRGPAVGVGWSIALACDLIVASDTARFSAIQARRGLAPDGGAVFFLARLLGFLRAKELVFTTRFVSAAEAASLQLVNQVVADDALEATALELARNLAQQPTFALAMAKQMFQAALAPSLDAFLDVEALIMPQLNQTEDYREGTEAFQQKRPAKFVGR